MPDTQEPLLTDNELETIGRRAQKMPGWDVMKDDQKRYVIHTAYQRAISRLNRMNSDAAADPFDQIDSNTFSERAIEDMRKAHHSQRGLEFILSPDAKLLSSGNGYEVYQQKGPGGASVHFRVNRSTGSLEIQGNRDPYSTEGTNRWIRVRTPATGPFGDKVPKAEYSNRQKDLMEAGRIGKTVYNQRVLNYEAQQVADQWGIPVEYAEAYMQQPEIGAWETFKRDWYQAIPGGGAAWDVGRMGKLLLAVNKLKKKQEENPDLDLSDTPEARMVEDFLLKRAEAGIRGTSIGGQLTGGILQLPAFMGEFLASGGAASLGNKWARRAAIKTGGRKLAKSIAGRGAGWVTGAAVRTASPAMVPRLTQGTLERMIPKDMELTDKGGVIVNEAGDKPLTAFFKAFGDLLIENMSETAGASMSKGLNKIPGMKKLASKLHGSRSILEKARKFGWDGLGEEWLEERLGGTLRSAVGLNHQKGDGYFEGLVQGAFPGSWQEALVEAGVLSVPAGGVFIANKAGQKLVAPPKGEAASVMSPGFIQTLIQEFPDKAQKWATEGPTDQELSELGMPLKKKADKEAFVTLLKHQLSKAPVEESPTEPEAIARRNAKARYSNANLVDQGVIIRDEKSGVAAVAVPVGEGKPSGQLDIYYTDEADAQKAADNLTGDSKKFPDVRVVKDGNSWLVRWGEKVEGLSEEEQNTKLGIKPINTEQATQQEQAGGFKQVLVNDTFQIVPATAVDTSKQKQVANLYAAKTLANKIREQKGVGTVTVEADADGKIYVRWTGNYGAPSQTQQMRDEAMAEPQQAQQPDQQSQQPDLESQVASETDRLVREARQPKPVEGFEEDTQQRVQRGEAYSDAYTQPAEPSSVPSTGREGGSEQRKMTLPDLIQLAIGINGGTPQVKQNIKGEPGTAGRFSWDDKTGKITIRADVAIGPTLRTGLTSAENADRVANEVVQQVLAENPNLTEDDLTVKREREKGKVRVTVYRNDPNFAAKVVAHEIGHLADWTPTKTLKRGNILGHIAALHKFIGDYISSSPKGAKPLTAAERETLRREAEARTRATAVKDLDEVITQTTGVKPEDVLAIWNNAEADIRNTNPELYQYIAGLSTTEKKQVILAAMKGMIPPQLERFKRVIQWRTGEKVSVTEQAEADRESIRKTFQTLVENEARKRQLFQRDEMINELKALTRWWRPFNPNENSRYTNYRYSTKELYADAISVLLNDPQALFSRAPNFYKAFFGWFGQRPEVKEAYEAIQDDIKTANSAQKRRKLLREMFREGDRITAQRYIREPWKQKRDYFFRALGQYLMDTAYVIKKQGFIAEKAGIIGAGENPAYYIEHAVYGQAGVQYYYQQLTSEVLSKLKAAGMDWVDLGEYMFHNRVIHEGEDYEPIFAPGGRDIKSSYEDLEDMRRSLGEKRMEILEAARRQFWEVRKQYIIPILRNSGMYSSELMQKIEENEYYATFQVQKYLERKHGKGGVARIYKRYGTFSKVTNPASATMAKDAALLRAADWNMAKTQTIRFLQSVHPDQVEEVKLGKNGFPDAPDGKGLIVLLDGGKLKGYYVDEWTASAFTSNYNQAFGRIARAAYWFGAPFRMVFTGINPGFWAYNVIRDYKRATKNLPKAHRYSVWSKRWFGRYMFKALKPSFRMGFDKPDALGDELFKNHALISVAERHGINTIDQEGDRLLAMFDSTPRYKNKVIRSLATLYHFAMRTGQVSEYVTKVASWQYLKENNPELSDMEVAHIVRTQAGSPSFITRGRATPILNNVFLFSNAFFQGWRSDLEALSNRPTQVSLGLVRRVLLPKSLIWMLMSGTMLQMWKELFGGSDDDRFGIWCQWMQRNYRKLSAYTMANYIPIPLGLTENGKTVYLNIPMDEQERLLGGVFMKILDVGRKDVDVSLTEGFKQAMGYTAGQAPNVNPVISTGIAVGQYITGHNPYDWFRGRNVLSERQFNAHDWETDKSMIKWTMNQLGASIIYRFSSDDEHRIKSELEEVVGYPAFVSNTLGRFVRVTDQGDREFLQKVQDAEKTERARENKQIRKIVDAQMRGDILTNEDRKLLKERSRYANLYRREVTAKEGGTYAEQFARATRTERDKMGLELLKREGPKFDLTPLIERDIANEFAVIRSDRSTAAEKANARKWLADRKIGLFKARTIYLKYEK